MHLKECKKGGQKLADILLPIMPIGLYACGCILVCRMTVGPGVSLTILLMIGHKKWTHIGPIYILLHNGRCHSHCYGGPTISYATPCPLGAARQSQHTVLYIVPVDSGVGFR